MKNPNEMTDTELDAAIAVEVMGWEHRGNFLYFPMRHKFDNEKCLDFQYTPTTDANQAREAVIKWTSLYKFDEEPIFDKHADWDEAAGDAFSKKREKDLEVINQVKTYQKKLIQIIFSQDFDWYNELTNGLSLSFYVLQSILEATPRQQCEALILAKREREKEGRS